MCLRQCGARDATRAGGRASGVSQATCGSGGRQPLRAGNWCRRRRPTCGGWRVLLFVAALGDGGKRTGWLLIFGAAARAPRCTAALPGKPDPAIFPRHWTNTLHLRLSDSLQSSILMRSALCVARACYWMDNPLNPCKRAPTSRQCPLARNLRGRVSRFAAHRSRSLLQTEQSMKARARELAVCVPYVKPSVDSHARSDLCLSPPILSPQSSYQPPQPDAAIRLGPKFQVSTVPAYQGPSCTDTCERGDQLLSLAEVELALARTTASRITAAAFHEPGVRLDLVKGEWLAVPRRRRQQPRCSTFGCSLPDLHAGLHQVARATLAPHP